MYIYYIRSAGIFSFTMFVSTIALSIFVGIATNWWVTRWAMDEYDLPKSTYMIIYGSLGISMFLLLILNSLFVGIVASSASLNIFKSIVWNILRRPMSFFDTTPSGTILNRCTTDISEVDTRLPFLISFFLDTFLTMLIVFILSSLVSPIVIGIIVVNFLLVICNFKRFVKTTTEVKRLVQISRSPVISIGAEFIAGITTIRNYEQNQNMIETYEKRADIHHSADFHEQLAGLWMRSRIEYSIKIVVGLAIGLVVVNQKGIR